MEEKAIRIRFAKHDDTVLLAATSEDLDGLVVFGKTVEEIERKLPTAIRELLEASHEQVGSVTVVPDDRISRAGFGPPAFIANASLVKHNDGRRI
jgi:Domain of unknown function (DUF1902)